MSLIKIKRVIYNDEKRTATYIMSRYKREEGVIDVAKETAIKTNDIEIETQYLVECYKLHDSRTSHIYVGDGICEPMMTPKQVYQLVRDLRKETGKPITIITGMTWEYLNKYNNTFTYLVQMVPFENIDVKCADETHSLDEYWIAV